MDGLFFFKFGVIALRVAVVDVPEAAPSTTRYNGISQSPERILLKKVTSKKKHSGPEAKGLDST